MEKIFQIRDTKPWFNNRTWVANNKSMNTMIYRNINIGTKNKFQQRKKIIGEDPNTGKNFYCRCYYCLSARKYQFTFWGPYFLSRVGNQESAYVFSFIMDSILNFVFYYNVSYKKMLQLVVAIVDEFTGKFFTNT